MTKKYTVYVDDNFHFMDESCRSRGIEYDSYDEAEKYCKSIIDDFLISVIKQKSHWKQYKDGLTENNLYEQWSGFGEDPFITSKQKNGKQFSSVDYARKRIHQLLNKNE